MKRRGGLILLLSTLGAAYAAACGALYFGQRALLYYPTPENSPAGALPMTLGVEGAELRIWTRPHEGPLALIYFGGNGEDVGRNYGAFAAALPDYALYFVNYRGYGGSTGMPTEATLFADADLVYADVLRKHPKTAVMGRSLGSGVAVHLAAGEPVERLILVTPYDSILNVARERYRLFPVGLLLRDRFESTAFSGQVSAPVLALLAEHDSVIHRERSEALLVTFRPSQAQVAVLPETGHNDIGQSPDYLSLIARFLKN